MNVEMKIKREKKPHKVLKFRIAKKKQERQKWKVCINCYVDVDQPLMQTHGYFILSYWSIKIHRDHWTGNTILYDSINRQSPSFVYITLFHCCIYAGIQLPLPYSIVIIVYQNGHTNSAFSRRRGSTRSRRKSKIIAFSNSTTDA